MVIVMFSELSESYKECSESNKKLAAIYTSIKRIEIISKNQEKMMDKISEIKNTPEVIKSKLDEAED